MRIISFLLVCLAFLANINSVNAQEGADFDAMYKKLKEPIITNILESEKYLVREIKIPYEAKYGNATRTQYKLANYDLIARDGSKQIIFDKIRLKGDLPTGLYAISNKKKDGILDINLGILVVPCLYERINKLSDSLFSAKKGEYYLYNRAGKLIFQKPFKYPVYNSSQHFIYDMEASELSLFSTKGILLYNFKAKYVTVNSNYFVLQKDGKQGIVDFKGKELLPFNYSEIKIGMSKGYLIIGNKTKEGVKYGMYTDYSLKNEIFQVKYDFLTELYLYNIDSNAYLNVYCYGDYTNHLLYVLDSTKKQLLQFNGYFDEIESLQKIGDYYLIGNNDYNFEIYTKGSGVVEGTRSYTEFSRLKEIKGMEDYILFNVDYADPVALLPEKFGPKRSFLFEAEYPSFYYYSNNCYGIIDEKNGVGFFLPKRTNPFVYRKSLASEEGVLDNFLKNINLVVQLAEGSDLLAYDLHNDSLIHVPANKSYGIKASTLMKYVCNKLNPILEKNFKNELLNTTIEVDAKNKLLYNWINTETGKTLFSLPFSININSSSSLTVTNEKSKYITDHNFKVWGMGFEDPSQDYQFNSISALFTDKWRLIKPLGHGQINRIMILPNDTIVGIEFTGSGDFDSLQIYSVARKKTIYFSHLKKMMGKGFFYPQFNSFGITNGEGVTGIISYEGKLLVPFKYDEFMVEIDDKMLTFFGDKYLYYFPKYNISIDGGKMEGAILFGRSNCFAFPNDQEEYGIYDIVTGKQLLPHVSGYPDYAINNRYIWVGHEDKYGVFDLKEQKLVEEIKHTSEDMNRIYEEKKYSGVVLEE